MEKTKGKHQTGDSRAKMGGWGRIQPGPKEKKESVLKKGKERKNEASKESSSALVIMFTSGQFTGPIYHQLQETKVKETWLEEGEGEAWLTEVQWKQANKK